MAKKNEENWMMNYKELKVYVDEHHHFPDKHKIEHRGLLHWVHYQRKRMKAGSMPEEQMRLFEELANSRWLHEHTGGRRKKEL